MRQGRAGEWAGSPQLCGAGVGAQEGPVLARVVREAADVLPWLSEGTGGTSPSLAAGAGLGWAAQRVSSVVVKRGRPTVAWD